MPTRPGRHAPTGTATPRHGTQDQRLTPAQRGYDARWRKQRLAFLAEHPLCARCEAEGHIEPATVVHHTEPHKGDKVKFWDMERWEALCKYHHDSHAQAEEKGGTPAKRVGIDGLPKTR